MSRQTINASIWLRWLKMNTAGRSSHRFSRPTTLSFTPLSPNVMSIQRFIVVFITACLSRFTMPVATPSANIGGSVARPASILTGAPSPPPPRLVKRSTGQPRFSATFESRFPGFTGRG